MSNWAIRLAKGDTDWRTGLSLIVGHDLFSGTHREWDHLLESFQTNQLDRPQLLLAESQIPGSQKNCIGSLFFLMQADGSASLTPPLTALSGVEGETLASELIRTAMQIAEKNGCTFAQSLLEPDDAMSHRRLQAAGIPRIGGLLMMQRPRGSGPISLPAEQIPEEAAELRLVPLGEQHDAPEVVRLLEQTYEESQDFPELVARKDGFAGLATHRLQGCFDPNHWYCLMHRETRCGLALLSWHAEREEWELVYLGLRKEFRGQGWARYSIGQLLSNDELAEAGMFLGVDCRNLAAIRLYKSLGFFVTGEHVVHFCWLSDQAG